MITIVRLELRKVLLGIELYKDNRMVIVSATERKNN